MFVGRDDKYTKFLVDILKNNRMLLISICPTNIEKNLVNSNENNPINNEESINSEFLPLE